MHNNTLYMAVDPAGGGFSGTAIVSVFVDSVSKSIVVASADSEKVDNDEGLEIYLRERRLRVSCARCLSSLVSRLLSSLSGILEAPLWQATLLASCQTFSQRKS